ncbi:MAG: hypothetical protein ABEI39_05995 [Halobacteriales archaeon]
MGLFDRVRDAIGMGADAEATEYDALLGMEAAGERMADLGYEPTGRAALCVAGVNTVRFRSAVEDAREALGEDRTADLAAHEDDQGFGWIVLREDALGEVTKAVHGAADALAAGEYGDRLVVAVFEFVREGERAYWLYAFGRGRFYPFAPRGGRERDREVERGLQEALEGEIETEPAADHWYPFWPGRPGAAPWVRESAELDRKGPGAPGRRGRHRR